MDAKDRHCLDDVETLIHPFADPDSLPRGEDNQNRFNVRNKMIDADHDATSLGVVKVS
jgi:hypothetical protein